jgi:hypothetical protein
MSADGGKRDRRRVGVGSMGGDKGRVLVGEDRGGKAAGQAEGQESALDEGSPGQDRMRSDTGSPGSKRAARPVIRRRI